MEHREYTVTFTIETDIRDVEQVTARLRKALDTAPLDPYFDYVDVKVEAEPFEEEEECPENGGPRGGCGHCAEEIDESPEDGGDHTINRGCGHPECTGPHD